MSITIEVRPVTVEDAFTVTRMVTKMAKDARVELAAAITARETEGDVDPTELGIALFQGVFTGAEEDLKAWLASLIGKPLKEFKAMPAVAVLNIIDALLKQEGIKDFFVKASQLAIPTTETS